MKFFIIWKHIMHGLLAKNVCNNVFVNDVQNWVAYSKREYKKFSPFYH